MIDLYFSVSHIHFLAYFIHLFVPFQHILETQIDPRKLADAAVYLYAAAAVLSRSSRSYCIGLKNSHHEV